jgi:hypothetical protein
MGSLVAQAAIVGLLTMVLAGCRTTAWPWPRKSPDTSVPPGYIGTVPPPVDEKDESPANQRQKPFVAPNVGNTFQSSNFSGWRR